MGGLVNMPSPTLSDVSPDAVVVVPSARTDAQRGTNLLAAYAKVAALTPNGSALGASNWATLIIPPGRYLLTSLWTIGQPYIRIVGLGPNGMPGMYAGYAGDLFANTAYSAGAVVTRATGGATVYQTADYIQMVGFCIENTGSARADSSHNYNNDCALVHGVSGGGASHSYYREMLFMTPAGAVGGTSATGLAVPVTTDNDGLHLNGLFEDCKCDQLGWWALPGRRLSADFARCSSTSQSFGGHSQGADIRGIFRECNGDDACFGGCGTGGMAITSSTTLINCTAGDNSFTMGYELAGTCINCHAGEAGFAGTSSTNSTSTRGTLTGTCIRCTSYGGTTTPGGDPFGAGGLKTSGDWATDGDYSCIEGGTLLDCEARTVQRTLALKAANNSGTWKGARLERTYWQCTGSDKNAITLLDSLSELIDSTILVEQGGAGIPVVSQAYDIQEAKVDDGGVFSDWTGGEVFPSVPANNDAFYILVPPGGCKALNVAAPDTPGAYDAADGACKFQYSQGGDSWADLTVSDGTENGGPGTGDTPFEVTGTISWDWPTDWAPDTVDGTKGWWVRVLVIDATKFTTVAAFTDGLEDIESDQYRVKCSGCTFNNDSVAGATVGLKDAGAGGVTNTVTNPYNKSADDLAVT